MEGRGRREAKLRIKCWCCCEVKDDQEAAAVYDWAVTWDGELAVDGLVCSDCVVGSSNGKRVMKVPVRGSTVRVTNKPVRIQTRFAKERVEGQLDFVYPIVRLGPIAE